MLLSRSKIFMHTLPKLIRRIKEGLLPNCKVTFHRAPVGEEEVQAVGEVIRSGWMTMGPKTFEFEKEFAKYVGAQDAIAVSTGTAALQTWRSKLLEFRLANEDTGANDKFTATAEAVTYTGARPVLVDIDSVNDEHGCGRCSKAITERPTR